MKAGAGGMKIEVQSYSGYKVNERPARFVLDGHEYDVMEILDQWFSPESTYFKIRADDVNHYILQYHNQDEHWTLESYRRPAAEEQKDV
jgi:hypothetical protein